MDWIGHDHVLLLKGIPRCEPTELSRILDPLGLEAFITTRYGLAESEIKRLLLEKGISYIWQLVYVQEAVLPCTPDREPLLRVLWEMLTHLEPTEELIIVDRYLLPAGCQDCVADLAYLLEPVTSRGGHVVIVTSRRYDEQLLIDLRRQLGRTEREIKLVLRTSENFHDRFWIADRSRGLFVGTSPNGIGKRYALAGYMNADDVKTIVDALALERLL